MRVFGQLVVAVCLSAVALAQAPSAPDAATVLAQAREALGGEKKLAAVKTLVATGRTRKIQGNNLVPIEFEIACELPDKYLRRDEIPAQESGPTATGFNGDLILQVPPPPPPPPPRAGGPAPPPGAAEAAQKRRVATIKQDFVRLTLGMFASSFGSYPLEFKYAGQAEAPQGKADVLDVKSADGFALRLFVNSQTHLPVMVSWQLPPTSVILTAPGQPAPKDLAPGTVVVEGPPPPVADAPQADRDKYTKDAAEIRKKAQAKLVEHRLYYADYRDVDGLQFPFRLRRAIGADTTEETTFDRFRLNTKIDPRKFEVAK